METFANPNNHFEVTAFEQNTLDGPVLYLMTEFTHLCYEKGKVYDRQDDQDNHLPFGWQRFIRHCLEISHVESLELLMLHDIRVVMRRGVPVRFVAPMIFDALARYEHWSMERPGEVNSGRVRIVWEADPPA